MFLVAQIVTTIVIVVDKNQISGTAGELGVIVGDHFNRMTAVSVFYLKLN